MWYNPVEEMIIMYISMKALRIISVILFAAIVYFNYSLSLNKEIPDSVQRKIGSVSLIIIIIMVTVGSCYGIFTSGE